MDILKTSDDRKYRRGLHEKTFIHKRNCPWAGSGDAGRVFRFRHQYQSGQHRRRHHSQSAETQASQGQEQTTIEMWYHISPDQATLLLQMIDEFQELHPGIKVETQSVAFAEIKKQLSIGVAADQLPDVRFVIPWTMFHLQHGSSHGYHKRGGGLGRAGELF